MIEIKSILKALMLSASGQMLNMEYFSKALPDIEEGEILEALRWLSIEGGDVYDIVEVQGHYFARTKPQYVEYLRRAQGVERSPKQRRALIEVLAIVALRQPVSRAEIEAIRCAQLNISILHDLQDYGWIKVVKVSTNDAHLYGTTLKFLQDFGLSSIAECEKLMCKLD